MWSLIYYCTFSFAYCSVLAPLHLLSSRALLYLRSGSKTSSIDVIVQSPELPTFTLTFGLLCKRCRCTGTMLAVSHYSHWIWLPFECTEMLWHKPFSKCPTILSPLQLTSWHSRIVWPPQTLRPLLKPNPWFIFHLRIKFVYTSLIYIGETIDCFKHIRLNTFVILHRWRWLCPTWPM